jgi:nitrile hydratase
MPGTVTNTSYSAGAQVRVREDTPSGHHRTPGYIKGKTGRVAGLCGVFLNPESRANGGSGLPKLALYRIAFDQRDVWDSYRGPTADKIYVDLYEHWLEPA